MMDEEQIVGIVTNAIGWVLLTGADADDDESRRTIDVDLDDDNLRLARDAATRVVRHLNHFGVLGDVRP